MFARTGVRKQIVVRVSQVTGRHLTQVTLGLYASQLCALPHNWLCPQQRVFLLPSPASLFTLRTCSAFTVTPLLRSADAMSAADSIPSLSVSNCAEAFGADDIHQSSKCC